MCLAAQCLIEAASVECPTDSNECSGKAATERGQMGISNGRPPTAGWVPMRHPQVISARKKGSGDEPNPLFYNMAPRAGFEPATQRLTAA
jgi:hypothetical protein